MNEEEISASFDYIAYHVRISPALSLASKDRKERGSTLETERQSSRPE